MVTCCLLVVEGFSKSKKKEFIIIKQVNELMINSCFQQGLLT